MSEFYGDVCCPRCRTRPLNKEHPALNALSRRDNETYICSPCGNEEALVDFARGAGGAIPVDQHIRERNLKQFIASKEQHLNN